MLSVDTKRGVIWTAVVAVIAVGVILAFVYGAPGLYADHQSTSTGSTSPVYNVIFEQSAACSSSFWGEPWGVTVSGVTKTQPPGTTLPITSLQSSTDASLSEITFSLHDGSYQYMVDPSANYFTPSSGSFTVSGSGLVIQIAYTGTSCTTATQSISSG